MKNLFFILTLSIGLLSFTTLGHNPEKIEQIKKNETAGPGDWEWCDGFATGVAMALGFDDWDEAILFENCMGIGNDTEFIIN